ncbi:MAG TPA: two-component regulator propeller domain-containing protein, partial [Saprospiraceae bacterium]|nr:two-component regulator propeller domain-containing protein [Saprospiraceae bacterium]
MKLQQLHICIGRQWLYAFFLLASISTLAQAQETMQVTRCLPVETRYPITNIHVDENNVKWVATSKDLFEVRAINLVNVSTLAADEQSLLNLPGGNHDLRWKKSELEGLLGKDFGKISAGFYDKKKQELWVGTTQAGVFQLKYHPKLQLIATHNNKNSKLKSNYINTILIDDSDRVWIGSQEGMLLGKAGRWSLEEKLFSFERVVTYGSEAWVLGDDFLWKVSSRGAWVPVDVDTRYIEGAMQDIAIDLQGRLWIASEVITRFDTEAKMYSKFGPIEYYTSQYASWITVDQEDAIWVGTEDKGLYLIEKASAITVNCIIEKESGCNVEQPDAALRVQVTGGTPPYTYAWSGGLSGANPQRIAPDTYTVTVTDSKGKSKVAQAVIANPRFEVQVKAESEERMPGANDGVASVIIAGNASEFMFQWDNGETTPTARKLSSGQHSVTVTDKKGCSAVGTVMISQQIAPINIAINLQNPIRCAGTSDAALEVQVSG